MASDFSIIPFIESVLRDNYLHNFVSDVRDASHIILRSARNRISLDSLGIHLRAFKVAFLMFANLDARLKTYSNWPKSMSQKPMALAEAGFFYSGFGDRVCCFFCGLGLKDWRCDDIPWKEHVMWKSSCHFAVVVKGPHFVQALRQAYNFLVWWHFINVFNIYSDGGVERIIDDSADKSASAASLLCKFCGEQNINFVNLPCGHMEKCEACVCNNNTIKPLCGICDQPIGASLKIYLT